MNFPPKTSIILALSALSALAVAVGCSREEEGVAEGSSDLTQQIAQHDLVISQVYGGGGNNGAKYTHDFVELFNQSDRDVVLAGKGLQYAPAAGNFSTTKNYLVLPETTPVLAPGKYFLVQLAIGGPTGGTPQGIALTDVDYVAQTPTEMIAMSSSAGKIALVDTKDLDLSNCDAGAAEDAGDAGAPCGDPKYIDLVGFGPNASEFRGQGPVPALSNQTAAVRRFGGCARNGDNAFDFEVAEPLARNGKTQAMQVCSGVDASAPPPPPVVKDAGTKADAGKKDGGSKKDAATTKPEGDDDDNATEQGDDDDDAEGDDDDGTSTGSPTKPKSPKKPVGSNANNGGVEPPQFPASKPDACAMTSGPLSSSGSFGAVLGLALAGAALRRRRSR